jgi:hypothetical protein
MAQSPLYGSQARRSEYRDRLAAQLIGQGSDSSPVQHWTQGAARLAQALAGGLIGQKQDQRADERQRAYTTTMQGAFSANDPEAMAAALAANPDTAPQAMQFRQMSIQQRAAQDAEQRRAAMESERFNRDLAARNEQTAAQRDFTAQQAEAARQQQTALAEMNRRTALEAAQLRAGNRADPLVETVDPNDPTKRTYVPQSQAAGMRAPTPGATNTMPPAMVPEERQALAGQLGVPLQPVDPLSTLPPKAAEALAREQAKNTERELSGLREETAQGRAAMADLNRFGQLQDVQKTGGIYSLPLVGGLARGVAGVFDPEVREMQSLSDKIAPTMRQPGSGATSDFDARMFQSATVGVDKDPQTNRNIIAGRRAAQQLQQDRLAFMEAYATANGGSLRGADQHWQSYLDANPIFDPTNTKTPTLNQNRQPFQKFFGGGGQAAPAQTPAQAPASGGGIKFLGFEGSP